MIPGDDAKNNLNSVECFMPEALRALSFQSTTFSQKRDKFRTYLYFNKPIIPENQQGSKKI